MAVSCVMIEPMPVAATTVWRPRASSSVRVGDDFAVKRNSLVLLMLPIQLSARMSTLRFLSSPSAWSIGNVCVIMLRTVPSFGAALAR